VTFGVVCEDRVLNGLASGEKGSKVPLRRAHPGPGPHMVQCVRLTAGPALSSYTKVYSVIYDSGLVPEKSIFSPRGSSPEASTKGSSTVYQLLLVCPVNRF
jgi:hypothetical protein